ncbi:nucleotidyl transferase AbiEii/AbiGii toxin family protein [Specibacter cremeus]|uniref:nucleotidyl transferase AbiEii/AbiGii toxin family protein n=1 Tax=Specibacter cremeus TaxID=1629051 RepID=UPI001F0C2483|nr:nucleotidyl transferase AbiEii/AbiGii toxin family protein [Specibacter cremeus]
MRNLAKRDGRDPVDYITLYALEGFLARLADSDDSADFVLKGGVLMAAFAGRRPTRDIDLAASGFPHDVEDVVRRVKAFAALDHGDGLIFDPDSVSGAVTRDEDAYSGVRVKLTPALATARIALHVDVNFGDPIWPAAVDTELPLLLGGTLRIRGYPDHMVLAEKIVTAIDRGDQNTRWRDFVDIVAITDARSVRQEDVAVAIEKVAAFRRVPTGPLAVVLSGMAEHAQSKWMTWRRKQRLEMATPERFQELIDRCIVFADPVLGGSADGFVWSCERKAWIPPL